MSIPPPPRARCRCPGGAPLTRHECVARRGDAAAVDATANALRADDGPPPSTPPSPWATANAAAAAPPKQSAARHRAARPERMSSMVVADVADNKRGKSTSTAAGRRPWAVRVPDVVGDRAGGGGPPSSASLRSPPPVRGGPHRWGRCRPTNAATVVRADPRTPTRRRLLRLYGGGGGRRQQPVRDTSPHRVGHGRAPAVRPPRARRRGGWWMSGRRTWVAERKRPDGRGRPSSPPRPPRARHRGGAERKNGHASGAPPTRPSPCCRPRRPRSVRRCRQRRPSVSCPGVSGRCAAELWKGWEPLPTLRSVERREGLRGREGFTWAGVSYGP